MKTNRTAELFQRTELADIDWLFALVENATHSIKATSTERRIFIAYEPDILKTPELQQAVQSYLKAKIGTV